MNAILFLVTTTILMSGCYYRIGDLTMVSTRNIDSETDYVLIQKYVVATAKSKQGDALQTAIDNAVKETQDGEYLKNVRVYVKNNGKKVKVEGDVWGIQTVEKNVTKTVNANIEFKVGDKVTFRGTFDKILEGTIIGLNANNAVIEYQNILGKSEKAEVRYEELTKLGQ